MAYVPSDNIGDIGLKIKLKKGIKKLGKSVGKVAKKVALPVATAVVTGGASLPAISVATAKQAAANTAKKSFTKAVAKSTSGKKPSQIPVETQIVASQQNIPLVSDDKIFGLDKKVVIFGGAGLGALLLILLVAKK